jgi:hypothetical protein
MSTEKPFKCFFSYYGSKAKIANFYPKAKYSTVIEPFCGAANYSVCNFENNVFLSDTNPNIIETWKFLINASKKDILSLPRFERGLDLRTLNLSFGERCFCGFWANRGSANPRNIVSNYAMANSNGSEYFENVKKQVSENLYRIKHWNVRLRSYEDCPKWLKATWFIDPPYVEGGQFYTENKIDYKKLGLFCRNLKGLIIVCENEKANWLEFSPIATTVGIVRKTTEVAFIREF